jgi:hypothetical protein
MKTLYFSYSYKSFSFIPLKKTTELTKEEKKVKKIKISLPWVGLDTQKCFAWVFQY